MIPLKTAIADDDRYICQQIQECLMQYSTQKDIDIDDPDIYTDCATLYNTDFTQKRYDLVFMDIDFSGGTEPVKHFSLFDGSDAITASHWAHICAIGWDIIILTLST